MSGLTEKIFIVDDDRFHLELMRQILVGEGFVDISLFESGVECLNQIHLNPDIVFLDHQMDVYSGYETLRKIKRYNPEIFVVMVSAQEEIKTAVDTLKHGAFDYFQKDEMLEENVKQVIRKINEVKELYVPPKSIFKTFLGKK
jgi:DNA-binding NtrC family response regulator